MFTEPQSARERDRTCILLFGAGMLCTTQGQVLRMAPDSKPHPNARQVLCESPLLTTATVTCAMKQLKTPHIIFQCLVARKFWKHVCGDGTQIASVRELQSSSLPPHIPANTALTFLLLCCWELWKHRNDVVFWKLQPSLLGAAKTRQLHGPAGFPITYVM